MPQNSCSVTCKRAVCEETYQRRCNLETYRLHCLPEQRAQERQCGPFGWRLREVGAEMLERLVPFGDGNSLVFL